MVDLVVLITLMGLAVLIVSGTPTRKTEERVAALSIGKVTNPMIQVTGPISRVQVWLFEHSHRFVITRRIRQYGNYSADNFSKELLKVILVGIFVFALSFYVFYLFRGNTLSISLLSATLILWFYNDQYQNGKIKTYRREIIKNLPEFLSLMVIMIESGYTLERAIRMVLIEVSDYYPSLSKELKILSNQIELSVPLPTAWLQMAYRTNCDDIRIIAEIFRGGAKGDAIVRDIKEQIKSLQKDRLARVREDAGKMPSKIVAVAAMTFLPALFIVIIGPAVYSIKSFFDKGVIVDGLD